MAISLYSGTPGSYKSYHATEDIIKWLMRGKNVIANFPVDAKKYNSKRKLGKFIFLTNTELTVSFLLDFAKANHSLGLKPQTLVVIDEASILFNPRQFERKDRMEWVNFFANHRHFNYEFILIAQQDRMLDRQIRGLLEYDYKHRALKNWNLAFALLSLACKGLYHVVEYWYPCKIKTATHLKKFSQRVANCYDTMALFKFSDDKKSDVQNKTNKTNLKSSFFDKSNIKLDKSKIKEAFNNEQSVEVSEKT